MQAEAMPQRGCEADDGDVLSFKVGGEALSIPAAEVAEVIRLRAITRIPNSPANLLGVANLRGAVLPVLSLAGLLGRTVAAPSPSSRIVVAANGPAVGLLVDEVSALAKPRSELRLDLPALLARDFGGLRQKIGGKTARSETRASESAKAADAGALALICFTLGRQEYALPLDKVVEVHALPRVVSNVPGTDPAMMGVIAFRGALLPLVSLHFLLGLEPGSKEHGSRRIVVTRIGRALVGLVVDDLKEIVRVPQAAIDPVPAVLTRGKGEARIEAICRLDGGRRLISVLSPATLFDTQTATRILADAEEGTAQMSSDSITDEAVEQFVIFRLGDEFYGLPIRSVDEIVRRPDRLTRVPRAPIFVEGVMNLRGRIVPVIDQRQRFSVAGESAARGARIVIVTTDGLQAGFVVDAVSEVIAIPASSLTTTPEMTADGAQIFDRVANIESQGRMILLIDPKAMLNRAERDMLGAISREAAAAS
jgi:purine-binding chemotaxis protein CheW